ncbi:MAG: TraR/DksA C4-type zinc finger protein [Gemmatimonadota bacterium]|nr:TraR/DksA C4-type zinc finger protein [Gemmatimonadota bacterium]
MEQKPVIRHREFCSVCGAKIPRERRSAMPGVSTCLRCQLRQERRRRTDDDRDAAQRGASEPAARDSVEVRGDLVLAGDWSGRLIDLVGRESEVRRLLAKGEAEQARTLVQALPVEEQAALVAMSEAPEEMLSMTGARRSGDPGYSAGVVELLPAETLGNLISIDPDEGKFNTDLIRAMSPGVLQSTMAETLDRVDNPGLRTRVSWEWLQALSTLREFDRRAELLRAVDPELLGDALQDRLEHLRLNEVVSFGGFPVYRFRLFSAEGLGGTRPSAFIDDPETGVVLDALYEAAPDLLSQVIRIAWERAVDDGESADTSLQAEAEQDERTEEGSNESSRRR